MNDNIKREEDIERRARIKRRIRWAALISITFIAAVVSYFIIGKKGIERKMSLRELVRKNSDIQIKDSVLLKKIVLDSLNKIGGIFTSQDQLLVTEDLALSKIDGFQQLKLNEFRESPFYVVGNQKYSPELTSKSFSPLTLITGERNLSKAEGDALQLYLASLPADMSPNLKVNNITLNPADKSLDIRKLGITSRVMDQQSDGTCWAFAAAGAFEINYWLRKGHTIKVSEQQLIDCSGIATIEGGLAYKVFEWMGSGKENLEDDRNYPYTGVLNPHTCSRPNTDYFASKWALVNSNHLAIASIKDIKSAICRYGSVVSSVYVTDEWLGIPQQVANQVYTDRKIYREPNNEYSSNHSVLIIGWDDKRNAWLIKNSWGALWGAPCGTGTERGYLWLDYQSCNIGKRAAWVMAR